MDYEAEFDNRARVPEAPRIIERWARDAAAFRASHAHADLAVAYGRADRQQLDIFWPGSARDCPLALYIHGGYWRALDRSFFSHLAAGLVSRGVAVAIPSFGLCPQVSIADIVDQVRVAAIHLATLSRPPSLVIGHSSGAHLAAMLLTTPWQSIGCAGDIVSRALFISGIFDLEPILRTSIGDGLGVPADRVRALSPVFAVPGSASKFHAFVGADETNEFKRQTEAIAWAWRGSWRTLAGANHFSILDPLADPQGVLVESALELLR